MDYLFMYFGVFVYAMVAILCMTLIMSAWLGVTRKANRGCFDFVCIVIALFVVSMLWPVALAVAIMWVAVTSIIKAKKG